MESGATITGTTPYNGSGGSPAKVGLGNLYTYGDTGWQTDFQKYFQGDRFAIQNNPKKTNQFYVSQDSGLKDCGPQYVVVQDLVDNKGLGTFLPLEKVAIILASNAYDTGTLIVQTYSPGIIASLSGTTPSVTITYDNDSGWSGPPASTKAISAVDSMYDALVNAVPGG